MNIIVDNRENYLINELNNMETKSNMQIEQLNLGDIIIRDENNKDVLVFERKTYSDLLSSIKDSRLHEQSYRLSNTLDINTHSIIYLLEGDINNYTSFEKKIIYSTITSLLYFKGFSVLRTKTVKESAELIVSMSEKINKDKGRTPYIYIKQPVIGDLSENNNTALDYCKVVKKVKKENVVKGNIGEIMLSQIPGVSTVTAIAILKDFDNFSQFIFKINQDSEYLNNITIETNGKKRKINKSSIEKIKEYLL